ncbi:MAG: hypothetical protein J7M25_18920 [Deltaproteobacteria bacterium]|nr:hypothetical protein [Deltaproteobacteria bacterium]
MEQATAMIDQPNHPSNLRSERRSVAVRATPTRLLTPVSRSMRGRSTVPGVSRLSRFSFVSRVSGMALSVATIGVMLAASGCAAHFRIWTEYSYKKIGQEKRIVHLDKGRFQYRLKYDKGVYWLLFSKQKLCQEVSEDLVREVAKVRIKAPLAPYYLGLGAVVMGISAPFFYMSAAAKDSTRRRNNALVGSLAFLAPGAALVALGIYQKMVEGTNTKVLGITHRKHPGKVSVCGTRPAKGHYVKVGTATGIQSLGTTDANGRVLVPASQLQPLVRHRFHKIVKVYLDVILDETHLGEMTVPWPIRRHSPTQ